MKSVYDTGDYNDVDPTSGHANYVGQAKVEKMDHAVNDGDSIRMAIYSTSILKGAGHPGQSSVRVESKTNYRRGLLMARFSQLPMAECGVWPAL